MGRQPKTFCCDSRKCFAQKPYKNGFTECSILIRDGSPFAYKDSKCPFGKPKRDYTDGVYYGNYEKTLRLLSHKERGKAV